MNILILTNMYPHPSAAFNGIFIHNLALAMTEHGHRFRVIYPVPRAPFPLYKVGKWKTYEDRFPDEYSIDGIKVSFPRFLFLYRLLPHFTWGQVLHLAAGKRMAAAAKRFKPDIICCLPAIPVGWAALKLSRKMSVPCVIIVLGADMNESVHRPGGRRILREVYSEADRVIVNSVRLQGEVGDIAPEARIERIHLGLSDDWLRRADEYLQNHPESQSVNDAEASPTRVLSVSNLIKTKGIEYNLRVLKRLSDEGFALQYTVVGEGQERTGLERLTESLGLSECVRFTGALMNEEIIPLIAESDFFSLPSYREGFGVVYIEAMKMGLPAIGCRTQGIDGVINDGENGLLVDPHDIDGLASAWRLLILDVALRAKLGQAAQSTVRSSYTMTHTATEMDAILNDVIGRRKE